MRPASGPTIFPDLRVNDPVAAYWLFQANLRLRREILWCRLERGEQGTPATLPPFTERADASLNQARYQDQKARFFAEDPTAAHLSEVIAQKPPSIEVPEHGSFAWLAQSLALNDTSLFAMALALLPVFDGSAGSVIAACLNDASATRPTAELAQRLWDLPEGIPALADPNHPLRRHGILRMGTARDDFWRQPFTMPAQLASYLLNGHVEAALAPLDFHDAVFPQGPPTPHQTLLHAAAQRSINQRGLSIQPLIGHTGADHQDTLQELAQAAHRGIHRFDGIPSTLSDPAYRDAMIVLAWLDGRDLFLNHEAVNAMNHGLVGNHLPEAVPITLYLEITDQAEKKALPGHLTLPAVTTPPIDFKERLKMWRVALGGHAAEVNTMLPDLARRFRFGARTILNIGTGLRGVEGKLTAADLTAACRAEITTDIGETAQAVFPRFAGDELVLPPKHRRQFDEIERAMRNLTMVHYSWGTARTWNESGISVLFAGPPGTGKSMGAEVLAKRLDLPMYRVDLSQVVNKYIGETEKNLNRLFEAADVADIILFFDEADALFGKRTDVKDAHDRYANIEVSYLLQRMENFKGLAILATNRKKDLDEAFLRRLRYIVDFPLPGEAEREAIWRGMLPSEVDACDIDFPFLAKQFPLAGGHIRSIAFNACLQGAADSNGRPRLTMKHLVAAIRREHEKLDRSISAGHFGPYATMLHEEDGHGQ